ncbi:MAG: hypothetical protein U7126_13260 [Microcoleus sp.]
MAELNIGALTGRTTYTGSVDTTNSATQLGCICIAVLGGLEAHPTRV